MKNMNRWSVAVACAVALTVGARAWGNCGKCEEKKPECKTSCSWDKCDADKDGKVSQAEFLASCSKAGCEKTQAKMEAKFKAMDKDSDGALTKEECEAGCAKGAGSACKSEDKAAEKK